MLMRSILLAALVSVTLPMMALAQTADELTNDEKTPGDVLTYGMGYSQHRFSPLTLINRDNVKRLVPAWSYSMTDNRGQEKQRLHHRIATGDGPEILDWERPVGQQDQEGQKQQ